MSNIFKHSNSRFSALLDDKSETENNQKQTTKRDRKDRNERKTNENSMTSSNSNNPNNFIKSDNHFKHNNQKRKENIITKPVDIIINDANFPELCENTKPIKVFDDTNKKSFLNLLTKKDDEKSDEDEYKENIEEGYIVMTKDSKTNKTIFRNSDGIVELNEKKVNEEVNSNSNSNLELEVDFTPQEISNVMDKIVEKYIKWKEDYIEMWGYDEYEKNYIFINYDYEYFDKLDEALYEEEYDNDSERNNEDDYITNQDHFENYWKY